MLVDSNLLIYAVDEQSAFHGEAAAWRTEQLNGPRRVGLPWQSLASFVRLTTHPRALPVPLTASQAWSYVTDWLDVADVWTPVPGRRHADILGALLTKYHVRGNLVPDAQLAALAVEHGLELCSADTDFARFAEVRWLNPLGRR